MQGYSVVRVLAARFVRDGRDLMAPFSLELQRGRRASLKQPDRVGAIVAARLAAAIVKPTYGSVTVGGFDSRLQPAQAKRLVGFVPHDPCDCDDRAFKRELGFRADVWNVDRIVMQREALEIESALAPYAAAGATKGFARAVALALSPGVEVAVLELPPFGAAAALAAIRPTLAIVETSVADVRAPVIGELVQAAR